MDDFWRLFISSHKISAWLTSTSADLTATTAMMVSVGNVASVADEDLVAVMGMTERRVRQDLEAAA
jgi:hypothetical protein